MNLVPLATLRTWLSLAAFCLMALLPGCTPPSYWAKHSGGVPYRSDDVADRLVQQARDKKLAASKGWLKLLHYRSGPEALGSSPQSDADEPRFFLAPRGKLDPEAELEATLRAILVPASDKTDAVLDAHPACRFPARTFFLLRELAFDPSLLGVPGCPGFNKYVTEMAPQGVSLVFTSYYLNNPASAFGHTFLRIHKANNNAVGERRELLDYGVDFSADVTTHNPIAYTVMGLVGLFRGTFKRMPYYYKVREYNDAESRDLWEYELNLDDTQLLMLVAHIWELGGTYFDYFYLGENCSYAILALVDVARPELDLMADVTSPVIPAATVQTLRSREGLVRNVQYRPSLRTQFEAKVKALSHHEQKLVTALVADEESALDIAPARQILVLDAAADLMDIRYARELLKAREEGPAAKRKQRILERRAQIRIPSADVPVATDFDKAPEAGHGARRVGIGAGRDAGNNPYVLFDFRLALHDLADPTYGYPEGSQIEFLRTQLRLGEVNDRFRVRVDRVDLVRVLSLTSLQRFNHPVSFQVAAGLLGVEGKYSTRTAGHFILGGGVTQGFARDVFMIWAMADAQLLIGLPFSDTRVGEDVPLRIGAGPSGGVRVRFHPRVVLLGTGHYYYYYPAQIPVQRYQGDLILRAQLFKNVALSAEARAHRYGIEAQGVLFSYF